MKNIFDKIHVTSIVLTTLDIYSLYYFATVATEIQT